MPPARRSLDIGCAVAEGSSAPGGRRRRKTGTMRTLVRRRARSCNYHVEVPKVVRIRSRPSRGCAGREGRQRHCSRAVAGEGERASELGAGASYADRRAHRCRGPCVRGSLSKRCVSLTMRRGEAGVRHGEGGCARGRSGCRASRASAAGDRGWPGAVGLAGRRREPGGAVLTAAALRVGLNFAIAVARRARGGTLSAALARFTRCLPPRSHRRARKHRLSTPINI